MLFIFIVLYLLVGFLFACFKAEHPLWTSLSLKQVALSRSPIVLFLFWPIKLVFLLKGIYFYLDNVLFWIIEKVRDRFRVG
jgi:hypothetical protein